MKKTRILPLLAVALLCNCGGSDDKGPETGDGKITVVEPTTALGAPNDDISRLQLKPGKLITLKQVNTTNCKRAAAAGMCIDIMAQDATVFAEGMSDAKLDALFSEAGAAIGSAAANLWGVHLPYGTYDISATDETVRTTAVAKLKAVITSVMKHMSPQAFRNSPLHRHDTHHRKRLRGTQGPEPEIAQGITDPHRVLQFDVRPAHDSLRGKLSPKRRLRCRNDARPAQRRGAGAGARLPRYGPRPDSAERVVYQSDQKRRRRRHTPKARHTPRHAAHPAESRRRRAIRHAGQAPGSLTTED